MGAHNQCRDVTEQNISMNASACARLCCWQHKNLLFWHLASPAVIVIPNPLCYCYSPSCPVTAQSPMAHMHGSGTAAAHMQWDAQRTRVWCGGQARTATVADACMHGRSTGPWQLLRPAVCSSLSRSAALQPPCAGSLDLACTSSSHD